MKKFLSLLLALTLVLSLVVVPARATGGSEHSTPAAPTATLTISGPTTAKEGDTVSYHATASVSYNGRSYTISNDKFTSWTWGGLDGVNNTGTYSGRAGSDDLIITCSASFTFDKPAPTNEDPDHTESVAMNATATSVSVDVTSKAEEANAAFKTAVAGLIQYAGRSTSLSGNKITAYKYSGDNTAWTVAENIGTTYTGIAFSSTPAATGTGTMTVTGTKAGDPATPVTATFDFEVKTASFRIKRTPASGNTIAGAKVALATESAVLPNGLSYEWKYTGTAQGSQIQTINSTSSSFDWTVPANLAADTYTVSCTAKSGSTVVATAANTLTVTVIADRWALFAGNSASLNTIYLAANQAKDLPTDIKLYVKNANGTKGDMVLDADVTYSWKVSNASALSINNNKVSAKTGASGTYAVTLTALYQGKEYTQSIAVVVSNLTATLSAVSNGDNARTYYISDMMGSARTLIAQRTNTNAANVSVSSLTFKSETNALGGSFSRTYATSSSGYITYTAPKATLGKAAITYTATSNQGTFDIIYYIPVIPVGTAFEAQYPQANATSSWNNNYTYTVTAPSGYDRIALVNKTGSTPSADSLSAPNLGNSSTITLNSNDFNSATGKCTLYVIAWNSNWTSSYNSGKYYCGPLEVYQKNYNINYNGVAGETVQFAQSDFTDFMNEVAEARGDASKTKSYPYVTFDYVTFSLPTTAQGTLYYGGTAMSTSNSSGAFNTRTKVTNLDSVTFVPNAKTTAKTITLNFILHATCYSSSSTSRGTTVSYSGSVVVNLVREDIKYTVSQGDSVRFDESDFLSYLRSTKGYTSNYTIDYVTFDQSAVSAVNEGSLYTYYNGYNYGGSVKTTDKFYYSATASQNALSDVAFLASRYAKTGETVYIPFTIYARYGTTGTGTRQLTGTVAIKIGQTMNFIDVKTTDYFYNSVKWAVGKNITNGTSSTTFSPYKSCTRAEIVTFLWRAAGSPEPTVTRNPFRDVNAVTHSSYYKAILWASQKGITSGTSATAFSPDQVCTRAQIVTFLYRYAGQPSGYYSNPFKDVGATSEASYYNAILWAVGKGITTGTSATTFSPYASCNRAEAVTFLYRYTNGL